MSMVRGMRNNNCGNLRHGDQWQGLAEEQTDPSFCQFTEMKWGCRALLKTLQTYHNKYNIDTVQDIVSRWAPTNENDTEAYIMSCCRTTHLKRDMKLYLDKNPRTYLKIAKAIAFQECGKPALKISDETWEEAYQLAFKHAD